MELPYIFISLLLLFASYVFTSHLRHKSANLPPTFFPALPIIGHLYLVKLPLYRTLAKISAKCGPIFHLQLGSRGVLVVSSPSAVEECLTKNDIIFANRPHRLFGKIIGANYTSMVWSSYGDNWRNLRRIAAIEILSIHRFNESQDIRSEEAKRLMRNLLSSSTHVDIKLGFYELTLNVMMMMISGKRYFGGGNDLETGKEGKRLRAILHETVILAAKQSPGDCLPFWSWFGMKGLEKKLISLQKKSDVFFQGMIEFVRKQKTREVGNINRTTMIEVLLSLQESEPEYYTDTLIRSFVFSLLAAGSDTSAGTMEWAMSLLVNHPQVLKKAQNEIYKVIGNNRFVGETDILNLPYLHCIINETLRLYPLVPLLIPHAASKDCVIGGYNIPRGTTLLINQWAIHHDPKVWADPEKFDPERFVGVEGTRDGFKLLPFGFGRRSCPGEALAVRVIGMTLGSLIQCFDWERTSEDLVDMSEDCGFTLLRVVPLVVKCKPRSEMKNLLSQL